MRAFAAAPLILPLLLAPAGARAGDSFEAMGLELLRADLRALAAEARAEREWRGAASLVAGGLAAAGGAGVLAFGDGADRERVGTGLLAGGTLLAAHGLWLRRHPRAEERLAAELEGSVAPEQIAARFAYGDGGFARIADRARRRRWWSAAGSFGAAAAAWFLAEEESRGRRLLATGLPALGGLHTLRHPSREEAAFRRYRWGLAAIHY